MKTRRSFLKQAAGLPAAAVPFAVAPRSEAAEFRRLLAAYCRARGRVEELYRLQAAPVLPAGSSANPRLNWEEEFLHPAQGEMWARRAEMMRAIRAGRASDAAPNAVIFDGVFYVASGRDCDDCVEGELQPHSDDMVVVRDIRCLDQRGSKFGPAGAEQ